jgi:hypothetical protein
MGLQRWQMQWRPWTGWTRGVWFAVARGSRLRAGVLMKLIMASAPVRSFASAVSAAAR